MTTAAGAAVLAGTLLAAPATGPHVLLRLTDPRIIESSGLAVSARHPGVLWTHNDSGGGARLYAVGPDGRTRARLTLGGLDPYDWEALAAGPGRTLWVGDVGDNSHRRDTVALFRVAEPALLRDATVSFTRFRLAYPDGPHDAEAVLVHPRTGRVYVATKSLVGGTLYAAPQRLRADAVNRLTAIAAVPPLITDGAFAPDGRTFVLRGYVRAWRYDARTLRRLAQVTLPDSAQGESIAFTRDGSALLAGSEGVGSPVWVVPLPRRTTGSATSEAPRPAPATPATPATPAPRPGIPWPVVGGALMATAALAALGWRRSR